MKTKISYSELLKDPRWQKRRLTIMQRDHFMCRLCGDTTIPLNVHHTKYRNGLNPWDYSDDELITVCECCHKFIENAKGIHGLNVCTEINGKCLKSKNPELRLKLYKYIDLSQIYVFNKSNTIVKVANILT